MNTPLIWALTAAEIAFGAWVASIDYPVLGGLIMGLSAGTFIQRASTERVLRDYLRKVVGQSEDR